MARVPITGAVPCVLELGSDRYIEYGVPFVFRAPSRGLGLIEGRFRSDVYKNYMAVSLNWGSPLQVGFGDSFWVDIRQV